MSGSCNTQMVDHCPETLADMLRGVLLLAWLFSPFLVVCCLLVLWLLLHMLRKAKGRRSFLWVVLLTVDLLFVVFFMLLAVSFVDGQLNR